MIDDRFKLNSRDGGHLGTFRTQLLATNYSRTEYVTDMLLITLFIKLIRNSANKAQDPNMIGIKMGEVLTRLKKISDSNPDKSWRRTIVQRYVDREKERVSQLPSQQLYLYDCIQEADDRHG